MTLDAAFLFSFLLVFVRASAMLIASPMFGAQNTPVNVRIMTTLAVAAALTAALSPKTGPVPQDLLSMVGAVANEAAAGLLIGMTISLAFYALQMAGAFLDFQVGLGSSQIINPATGVPVTILAQFKFMLGVVIFLAMNGHHTMFGAFVQSYDAVPTLSKGSLMAMQANLLPLVGTMCLLALQIAAPVAAVSLIVDAGLGIVNKAVPQMPVMVVGMPGKILLGLLALGMALPSMVAGVDSGVNHCLDALWRMWKGAA